MIVSKQQCIQNKFKIHFAIWVVWIHTIFPLETTKLVSRRDCITPAFSKSHDIWLAIFAPIWQVSGFVSWKVSHQRHCTWYLTVFVTRLLSDISRRTARGIERPLLIESYQRFGKYEAIAFVFLVSISNADCLECFPASVRHSPAKCYGKPWNSILSNSLMSCGKHDCS